MSIEPPLGPKMQIRLKQLSNPATAHKRHLSLISGIHHFHTVTSSSFLSDDHHAITIHTARFSNNVIVIEFFTNTTKMPILAFLCLLRENKKSSDIKCYPPMGIKLGPLIASDSKTNSLLSELVRHVLLRSLSFCSCTT